MLSQPPLKSSSSYHLVGLAFSLFIFSTACNGGDPVDLTESTPYMPMMPSGAGDVDPEPMSGEENETQGGDPMGGEVIAGMPTGGTPAGGTSVIDPLMGMEVCVDEPDIDLFNATIGPNLILGCARAGCHVSDGGRDYKLPVSRDDFTDPLEGDLADRALSATLPYLTFGDGSGSELSLKAYNQHNNARVYFEETSEEYSSLIDWIDDARRCEIVYPDPVIGGEDGPGGATPIGGAEGPIGGLEGGAEQPGTGEGTQVFCDILPNGDPLNRGEGEFYAKFRDEVNAVLLDSCSGSMCHSLSSRGFWLIDDEEPCNVEANFITSLLYINYQELAYSPILSQPFDNRHLGYGIFGDGRETPDFLILQSWVNSSLR